MIVNLSPSTADLGTLPTFAMDCWCSNDAVKLLPLTGMTGIYGLLLDDRDVGGVEKLGGRSVSFDIEPFAEKLPGIHDGDAAVRRRWLGDTFGAGPHQWATAMVILETLNGRLDLGFFSGLLGGDGCLLLPAVDWLLTQLDLGSPADGSGMGSVRSRLLLDGGDDLLAMGDRDWMVLGRKKWWTAACPMRINFCYKISDLGQGDTDGEMKVSCW
ncbi:hypothetical protein ACLOJK_036399 [Asimina triloba]